MSVQALSAALSKRIDALGLSCPQRFILFLLANWANEDDMTWPSVKTLTAKTGLSERGVQVAVAALIKLSLIERIARQEPGERQKSNFYQLTFVEDAPTPAPGAPIPPQEVHPIPAPGAPLTSLDTKLDTTDADASGGRARDIAFDRLKAGWTRVSPGRLAPQLAAAAFAAVVERFDPDRVAAAGERYLAEDPDIKRLGTAQSLDRWLSAGRFEPWLPPVGEAAVSAPRLAKRWDGPAAIRDAVVDLAGEAFAGSYLDPACWDGERQAVLAATGVAVDALRRFRTALEPLGVAAIEKRSNQQRGER